MRPTATAQGIGLAPEVELIDGVPARAWIASATRPGRRYGFERGPRGRWSHTDSLCEGWTQYGRCYHVAALEGAFHMTTETTETGLGVAGPLDIIENLDQAAIITALTAADARAVRTWCYTFSQDGKPVIGLSVDGVQEAAREMARRGELIDQEWVRLDRETETEAYFSAKAVRYTVMPDGRRVPLDSAIRSKRQEKMTKLREPLEVGGRRVTHVPNRYWYEVGTAKAVRNAVEALLPEAIKGWMIDTAKAAGRTRNVERPARPAQDERPPEQGKPPAGSQENPRATVLKLLQRLKGETDAEYQAGYMDALAKTYPRAFSPGGPVSLSALSPSEALALAAQIRRDLDGLGAEKARP